MSPRRAAFAATAALAGTLLALAAAELGVRGASPRLAVQSIGRSHPVTLIGEGDGLYWRSASGQERTDAGCPSGAEGARVLLQGSSILYGSNVNADEAPGPRLRAALEGRGVTDACVVSHAEPASTFWTQRADLRAAPAAPADVLVWELWQNSPNTFLRVGDAAWNFGDVPVGPDGVPDPFGVGGLARVLLAHSHLYTWVVLRRAPPGPARRPTRMAWGELAPVFVDAVRTEAGRRGAAPLVVSFPNLRQPFSEQLESNARSYGPVLDALRAAGIETLEMDRALLAHDPAAIRADTCCHYNPAGVDVVTGILADALRPLLGAGPAPPAAGG